MCLSCSSLSSPVKVDKELHDKHMGSPLQDLTKSYMTNTWVHPQFFVIRLFSFLCGVFVLFLSVFILCIVPNVVYVSGLSLLDSHFNIPLRSSKTNLSFHVNRCFTLMDFKCNHFLAM
jgi:hypothetical protein